MRINNLDYFKLCLENPEPIWDKEYYPFLQMNISKKEFDNILNLEDYLKSLDYNAITKKEISVLLELLNNNGCEKSYFSFFLRTCDLSVSELVSDYYNIEEKMDAIKSVLILYKKERNIPKTDKYSLQAYNDGQTAKRRSSAGEDKIISLSGFSCAENVNDLEGKIAKISKSRGEFTINKIKRGLNINFELPEEDKVPDCIFVYKNNIYIVEAKHVNGQGGAQNGSIRELISLVELKNENEKIHYIAFLDGCYTKYLSFSKPYIEGNQIEKQLARIYIALENNSNNYFLNTFGFKKFISDLTGC